MSIDKPAENVFASDFEQETINKLSRISKIMDNLISLGTHIIDALRRDTATHPDKKSIILVLF